MPRDSFATAVSRLAAEQRKIFTPFRPEVLGSESAGDVQSHVRITKMDPWDGRQSREEVFIGHLKAAAPSSEIVDLDPIVDSLRAVKSPREIAIIREATRLAGLGIMEAMRDAEPGMHEYELEAAAEYVYKRGGAYGESYFPLIADGPNMPYTHYHKNEATLKAGDLVQFDWAPDIANYTSDVTRVFPANGKFTPRQREFYTIYLRLYQALMSSIRVHATARAIMDTAVVADGQDHGDISVHRSQDPVDRGSVRESLSAELPMRRGAADHSAIASAWRCTMSAIQRRRSSRDTCSPSSRR